MDADRARSRTRDRRTPGKSAHNEATELGKVFLEFKKFGAEFLAKHIERALGGLVGCCEVEQLAPA